MTYLYTRNEMPTLPPPDDYEMVVDASRPLPCPCGSCAACDGLGVVFGEVDAVCACAYEVAA